MAQVQTKSGRYVRAYFNGTNVGLARMKASKVDISTAQEAVIEMGNPNVVEYVPKVAQATLNIEYMMVSYGQLIKALGITYGSTTTSSLAPNGVVGEVPPIPGSFDMVERLIVPGTEKTANEQYYSYTLHQKIAVEKEAWDEEADKIIAVNVSAKSIKPRRYEGINGIMFDSFSATGSQTAFVLSHRAVPGYDGYNTARADINNGAQSCYEGFDYTSASTSSTTTVTFNTAPPAGPVTIIYAY